MALKRAVNTFQLLRLLGPLLIIQICDALRILMLDVPSPTVVGESVELTCNYELDNDQLYSIKWYHNDVEFYRYVPNDWPPGQFLPMPGIKVDLSRSGKNVVYLRHVDLKTSGLFRCEVSAEAPEFKTAELEKEMKVFVLPVEGPRITGSKVRYNVGDMVNINCTSAKSKPAAKLKWFINDEVSPTTYELEYMTALHSDGLETSTLGLRFTVNEKHFQHGNMKLRCTATISRVYAMSNEALVLGERKASPLQINSLDLSGRLRKAASADNRDTATQVTSKLTIAIYRWTLVIISLCSILQFA